MTVFISSDSTSKMFLKNCVQWRMHIYIDRRGKYKQVALCMKFRCDYWCRALLGPTCSASPGGILAKPRWPEFDVGQLRGQKTSGCTKHHFLFQQWNFFQVGRTAPPQTSTVFHEDSFMGPCHSYKTTSQTNEYQIIGADRRAVTQL